MGMGGIVSSYLPAQPQADPKRTGLNHKMPATFHVHRHQRHLKWSRDIKPVLTVSSGQTVTFECQDAGGGVLNEKSTAEDIANASTEQMDPVFGPVYINNAKPGDTLQVEILNLEFTSGWGWTALIPGFGLLADEFSEAKLKIWSLPPKSKNNKTAVFRPGIEIPLRPFLGEMGVAPGEEGEFSTIVPLDTGGNIDCRHLTAGSTLFLPVKVPGALFSCGDGHAAQGDGEVCGTAIETSITATLRFTVLKGQDWVNSPQYHCAPPGVGGHAVQDIGHYAVMGIDPDLKEATRKAIRGIINYLVKTQNMSREEAYMLASVAVHLRMSEVVDVNYGISAALPLNLFVPANKSSI